MYIYKYYLDNEIGVEGSEVLSNEFKNLSGLTLLNISRII